MVINQSLHGRRFDAVRRAEMNALLNQLEAMKTGTQSTVEIVGEPGSGKTYLVSQLVELATREGLPVLTHRCVESDRQRPLHPFHEILPPRRSWPRGPETAAWDALIARAAPTGLVVALDDLHLVDDASQRLISQLLRRPAGVPLLLVLAHRPRQTSLGLHASLAAAVDNGRVQRLELPPLSVAQTAELLGSPENPELCQLHRQSQGNPLYLLALADLGGARLASQLSGELDGLTEHESLAAAAAGVLGASCDVVTLAAVAELDPAATTTAVDGLLARDLLRPLDQSAKLTVRHPLVGQLLRDRAPLAWRAAAHRRAVAALSRQATPAGQLAWHIERSTPTASAADVSVLIHAADQALPDDPVSATRWLRTALGRLPEEDRPLRVELLLALARATIAQDDLAQAAGVIEDLLTATRQARPAERADAVAFVALYEAALGNVTKAQTMTSAELTPATDVDPATVGRLACADHAVGFLAGQLADEDALATELRRCGQHGLVVPELITLALLAYRQVWSAPARTAAATVQRCARRVDSLPDAAVATDSLLVGILGWAESLLGRHADAERHLTRGLWLARRCGDRHLIPVFLTGLGHTYQRLGRLAEARRVLAHQDTALGYLSHSAVAVVTCALDVQARTEAERTRPERARALVRATTPKLLPRDNCWTRIATLCLADAARQADDLELCGALLLGAGGSSDLRRLPAAAWPAAFEALTAVAADSGTPARQWADAASDTAGLPHQRAHAILARAHLDHASGDLFAASSGYRTAADVFADAGLMPDQIRALTLAGLCADRPDEAANLFSVAKQLARQCDAARSYATIDELARTSVADRPTVPEPRSPLAVLTDREREIAVIASTGMRTREIAEHLGISPRTVDAHLARSYRKLNISSRAALARLVAESD